MDFYEVSVGIAQERLAIRADRCGLADFHALVSKLADDDIDVANQDRKVLADIRWSLRFDQVDLGGAEVDPCSTETEIRAIRAYGPAEDVGVEGHATPRIRDVDRDMMHSDRIHRPRIIPTRNAVENRSRLDYSAGLRPTQYQLRVSRPSSSACMYDWLFWFRRCIKASVFLGIT